MTKALKIGWMWGFFSCCSVKLSKIIEYIKENKHLPRVIDYSDLFTLYQKTPHSIHHIFFNENILNTNEIDITNISFLNFDVKENAKVNLQDPQFSNYKNLQFNLLNPLIKKYFTPSNRVLSNIDSLKNKYPFTNKHICSIIYRGNDKRKETIISPYTVFIDQAKEILNKNLDTIFHIQTDETEFKNFFIKNFPNNSFFCDEIPSKNQSMTSITEITPIENRVNLAINFLSLIYLTSQSHTIITHSGNVGLWSILLRGNTNNVYQVLNNVVYS